MHGGDDQATSRRNVNRFLRCGVCAISTAPGHIGLRGADQPVRGEVGKVTRAKQDPNGFQLFQVAFNTCDLAGTLRLYADIFGFANGGAQLGCAYPRLFLADR